MKKIEGLRIYFTNFKTGHRYGPVKLNSLENLQSILQQHNEFDAYLIIENKNNSDNIIERGEIEHPITRKRKL